MGQARTWKIEEIYYLQDKWGTVSIKSIAAYLKRTENAIIIKARRLGLGAFLESGEYVTFNQLRLALGITSSPGYMEISWIKNRGFPMRYKRVNNCTFRIVYLDEFWCWLERNRAFVDLSRFEENALGIESDWIKQQRRHDCERRHKYKNSKWTPEEDSRLIHLINQYKYTYFELSRMLGRTPGAIQKRLCDLGIKGRPVKADNHIKWTDEEYSVLEECIRDGVSYEIAAEKIGKSPKALRGKVYNTYGTENLDKARREMRERESWRGDTHVKYR